ncbi:hypothetical protein ABPG77_006719 [Micractinium sp. CCAP 211/92]
MAPLADASSPAATAATSHPGVRPGSCPPSLLGPQPAPDTQQLDQQQPQQKRGQDAVQGHPQAPSAPPPKRQRQGATHAAPQPTKPHALAPAPAAPPLLPQAGGSADLAAALDAALASAGSSPRGSAQPAPAAAQQQQLRPREQLTTPSRGLGRSPAVPVVETLQQLAQPSVQVVHGTGSCEGQTARHPYALVSLEMLQALHRAAQYTIYEARADLARQLVTPAVATPPAVRAKGPHASPTASAPLAPPAGGQPRAQPMPGPAAHWAAAAVPPPAVAPAGPAGAAGLGPAGHQAAQLLQQAALLLTEPQAAAVHGRQPPWQPLTPLTPAAAAAEPAPCVGYPSPGQQEPVVPLDPAHEELHSALEGKPVTAGNLPQQGAPPPAPSALSLAALLFELQQQPHPHQPLH